MVRDVPDWPTKEIASEVAEGFPTVGGEIRGELDVPDEIGALAQWRAEVANRVRRKETLDSLAVAAIHELNARDELRLGLQSAARKSRLDAIDTIIMSVAEHAA